MKIKELRKEVKNLYDQLPEDFKKEAFKEWDMENIEGMNHIDFLNCYRKMQDVIDVIKLLNETVPIGALK